jgi:hypothetical protein
MPPRLERSCLCVVASTAAKKVSPPPASGGPAAISSSIPAAQGWEGRARQLSGLTWLALFVCGAVPALPALRAALGSLLA